MIFFPPSTVTELVDRWWSQDERTQEWEGTEGLNCRASLSCILSVAGVTWLPLHRHVSDVETGHEAETGCQREREASFWGEEAGWTRKFLAKLWVCVLGLVLKKRRAQSGQSEWPLFSWRVRRGV